MEWGGIARLVVSDRRALRAMGFLSRRRPGSDEAEEDLDEAGEGDTPTDDDTLVSVLGAGAGRDASAAD